MRAAPPACALDADEHRCGAVIGAPPNFVGWVRTRVFGCRGLTALGGLLRRQTAPAPRITRRYLQSAGPSCQRRPAHRKALPNTPPSHQIGGLLLELVVLPLSSSPSLPHPPTLLLPRLCGCTRPESHLLVRSAARQAQPLTASRRPKVSLAHPSPMKFHSRLSFALR